MNDKHLRSFITIAECGSFTKAEQLLCTSKQALKKQMDTLEDEVGIKVLERSRQGVILTKAGTKFLEGSKQILALTESVIEQSKTDLPNETLRIAVLPDMIDEIIVNVIPEFTKVYSKYNVECIPMSNAMWLEAVDSEKVDVCLCADDTLAHNYQLDYTRITTQTVHCLMNNRHPLANHSLITLSDLQEYYIYIGLSYWYIKIIAEMKKHSQEFTISEIPYNHNSIKEVCLDGGIYMLSKGRSEHFSPLVSVPLEINAKFTYGLAYKKNPPLVVKHFVEIASKIYSSCSYA